MAADERGNDLSEVNIPITGTVAVAPVLAANVVSPENGADPNLALLTTYPAYKILGLLKQDGGAEAGVEAGDALEFFQDGYKLSSGDKMTIKIGLAESNAAVIEFIRGQQPDNNGRIRVSSAIPDNSFLFFRETVYKNKARYRNNGVGRISEAVPNKDERGSVNGYDVTIEWLSHDLFDNAKFDEWRIAPPVVVGP